MNTIKSSIIVALSACSLYGYTYLENQHKHAGILVPLLTTIVCLLFSKSKFKYSTILLLIAQIFMKFKVSNKKSLIPFLILMAMPFILFSVIQTTPTNSSRIEKEIKTTPNKDLKSKVATLRDYDFDSPQSQDGNALIKLAHEKQKELKRKKTEETIRRINMTYPK
jgi:hypothetical protein